MPHHFAIPVRGHAPHPAISQQPPGVDLPDEAAAASHHLRYIPELIGPLAATLFSRSWGVGFSDYCLLSGDVPVLVLNGQDHADQQAAVAYWDVYPPIDPHRCLYLPGTPVRPLTGSYEATTVSNFIQATHWADLGDA